MPALPTSEETTATTVASITSASPSSIDNSLVPMAPPEPRFSVNEINISNLTSIHQHIVYSPNISLLLTQPQLKAMVRTALERTITDWIGPIVDRSIKIALKTGEQIVRKDFALDSDEHTLRTAAHNIVRNLSAGTAMITQRESLQTSIHNQIKSLFIAALSSAQKEIIEVAATQLAADNIELVCVFMQKTAMEKAAQEIDKLLASDYEVRKQARAEGRRYYDAAVVSYQRERLPEAIRLKIGSAQPAQWAVYDEFARNIPGFQPVLERDAIAGAEFMPKLPNFFTEQINAIPPVPTSVTPFSAAMPFDEIGVMYDEIYAKIDSFLNGVINIQTLQLHFANVQQLYEALMTMRRSRDHISSFTLLTKTVETLMEGLVSIPEYMEQIKLYRDIHLRILRLLQDNRSVGTLWTNKTVAKCMIDVREEIRYNVDAVDILISSNFVNLQQYDQLLTQLIDGGNNYVAMNFAMQLLQMYFIDERANSVVTESDFINTIELLTRLSVLHRAPDGLAHLIEVLRSSQDPTTHLVDRAMSGPTSYIHSGMLQARVSGSFF